MLGRRRGPQRWHQGRFHAGDLSTLQRLLADNPSLAASRLGVELYHQEQALLAMVSSATAFY
jgi:hypothetical protein